MNILDIIKLVATVLIVYFLVVFMVMKTSGEKFTPSVELLQSIMMTIGALSFVYSYIQTRRAKTDKIERLAGDVPAQWGEVLQYMKGNDKMSPHVRKWILTGDSSHISNGSLNIEDLNFVEFVINKMYDLWLLMVEFGIAKTNTTKYEYKELLSNASEKDRAFMNSINMLFKQVFAPKFIQEHIERESAFYPAGFMNYVQYCISL